MHISEVEALVLLLEDWAHWQSSYRPNTGFKSRSAGFSSLGLQSFDDMCHQSDNATMRALDSAIDDLDPAPRAAINRKYGVCSVFRFPRSFEDTLILAHDRLVIICKRKGVVL